MLEGLTIADIFSLAVQAWVVVLIAVLLARFVGNAVRMPRRWGAKFRVVAATYLVTFVALLLGGFFSNAPSPFLSFALPVILGAFTARAMMKVTA
ncbi:hypothetical protein [Variovorax sp.]|uniref:hypothetical protein n=1 Tax=Variovorax sp. TaxID=1871043 RepID=UPI003BABED58